MLGMVVVLAGWVGLTVALFAVVRGRDAAIASMIAGWALLPNAAYPSSAFTYPVGSGGSWHALAVPTAVLVNKACAIGLGGLAGVLLFDWALVRRLRPGLIDLPIAAWCLAPVASALSNALPLAEGLSQARYLALSWGVPYLLGRVYLGESRSLHRLGLAFVLGGLLYAPFCLVEFFLGPFLYTLFYGPQPYQLEGAGRALGYRPMVFLEHGNQLGLWAALTASSAAWLAAAGRLRPIANVPGRVAAIGLVSLCVLDQSHGAIGLLAVVLLILAVLTWGKSVRSPYRTAGVLVVAVTLAAVGVGFGVGIGGRAGGLRGRLKSVSAAAGKESFTWRFARYENDLARVAERPVFGWSRADWSPAPGHTFVNPVNLGLWLHALGMFGVVGFLASTAVFVGPVIEVVRWLPFRAWLNPECAPVTLAAVLLLVSLGDSLLNSTLILPVLAAAGGLNSWSERRGRGR